MATAVTITPDSAHASVPSLQGYSLYEDAGATAYVRLRRGSVSGQIVAHVSLGANETRTIMFPHKEFIQCGAAGCYVEEVSGSITGILYAT